MVTQDSIFIQYHNNDNCGSMLTEKLINIFLRCQNVLERSPNLFLELLVRGTWVQYSFIIVKCLFRNQMLPKIFITSFDVTDHQKYDYDKRKKSNNNNVNSLKTVFICFSEWDDRRG